MTLIESLRMEAMSASAAATVGSGMWADGMRTLALKFNAAADALEQYGQHGDGCPAWDGGRCTCGFCDIKGDR